eukprot:scaffold1676_cov373-Prasinococcus_capsulatus_cf.AAC.5
MSACPTAFVTAGVDNTCAGEANLAASRWTTASQWKGGPGDGPRRRTEAQRGSAHGPVRCRGRRAAALRERHAHAGSLNRFPPTQRSQRLPTSPLLPSTAGCPLAPYSFRRWPPAPLRCRPADWSLSSPLRRKDGFRAGDTAACLARSVDGRTGGWVDGRMLARIAACTDALTEHGRGDGCRDGCLLACLLACLLDCLVW